METRKILTVLVLLAVASVIVGPGQQASGGTLAGWGWNRGGRCDVPAGNDFVVVAAGANHSLAIKSDGSLAAWGENTHGQRDVPPGNDFVAVAGGGLHSLALKSDGSLAAWGSNSHGQRDVPPGNDFVAVAGGYLHSLALKSDGSLAAWGVDDGGYWDYGQVTDAPAGNDFVAVAAGYYHSLALKSDGSLEAWGIDDGSSYDWGQVTDVAAGNDFVAVSSDGGHNLALKSDGSLAAWGWNDYGQCDVPAGYDFVAIAAGSVHSLAIKKVVHPMGTAFTYQGRLIDADSAADGFHDFQFKLFNDPCTGDQLGSTIDFNGLDVFEGYFTVELDFGSSAFDGDARWLEIGVRSHDPCDVNPYTRLLPRQEVTATPYAMHTRGIFVDDAGRVGIGTKIPKQKLHIENGGIAFRDDLNPPNHKLLMFMLTGVGDDSRGYKFAWRNDDMNLRKNAITLDRTGDVYLVSGEGGNVGIGTTNPSVDLEVSGTLRVSYPSDLTKGLEIEPYSGAPRINIRNMQPDYGLNIVKNGVTSLMFLKEDGNVGIGMTDPKTKLEVAGDGMFTGGDVSVWFGNKAVTLRQDGANTYLANKANFVNNESESNGALVLNGEAGIHLNYGAAASAGTTALLVDNTGNVGIGTINPGTAKLAVMGGNVGIGTTGPSYKLDVEGGGARITNHGDGAVLLDLNTQRNWQFRQLGAEHLTALELASVGGGGGKNFIINTSGKVGIGTTEPGEKLDVAGTAKCQILKITGADLAEKFPLSEEVKPGMVVAIDPNRTGQLHVARGAYNRRVAGVVSGANGLSVGAILGDLPGQENTQPIALSGRVWVYCDAGKHPIAPGDLLTTSGTPGHAMKVTNYTKAQGAIIGKAMTSLKTGKGLVLVLVTLQ
ncbi:MAG: RCC1 domain-containing protein [Planctomycetota bacterium]